MTNPDFLAVTSFDPLLITAGAVKSVAGVAPDASGNVPLTGADIGAASQTVTLTGDVTGSGTSAVTTSLSKTKAVAAGGIGLSGKGFNIPAGSLDTWRAARNASGATLCEVVGFGDSLMWGQGPVSGSYSFLQRLRENAVAAGFLDGGRGINAQYNQTVDSYGTEPTPIQSITGFAASLPSGMIPMPGALFSQTANDTVTFQFKGTRARLWWHRYTAGGRFSYSVNGGAAVIVQSGASEAPPIGAASIAVSSIEAILLTSTDGLTSGTNTVAITNLGGSPTLPPTIGSVGSSTGTLPAGTYYYVGTTVSGGETTPGTAVSRVTSASTGNNIIFNQGQGGLTVKVYRSATGVAGSFQLIGSTTGNNNAVYSFVDDGSATPGTAPPTTNTAALDPANKTVAVNIEPINATGIVWQNHGVQGQDSEGYLSTGSTDNNIVPLAALGLQWGTGTNGITQYSASELLPTVGESAADSPIPRTAARKPALVIFAYGTNDIQHADGGANPLVAPIVATAGTGVGSGLPAGTYYYKVQRVSWSPFGGGELSPASSGVTVSSGQQVAVTANAFGAGIPVFNVYRATSSGGTYGLVGQIVGGAQTMLDSVATPGPSPAQTSLYTPMVNTYGMENALALGLRLARNAGADSLVILPSIESLNNSRSLGGVFKAAIKKVADTFSAAWVDFDVVLGPVPLRAGLGYGGGNSNPHLLKPAYQAQGDFIWNNVLSL